MMGVTVAILRTSTSVVNMPLRTSSSIVNMPLHKNINPCAKLTYCNRKYNNYGITCMNQG